MILHVLAESGRGNGYACYAVGPFRRIKSNRVFDVIEDMARQVGIFPSRAGLADVSCDGKERQNRPHCLSAVGVALHPESRADRHGLGPAHVFGETSDVLHGNVGDLRGFLGREVSDAFFELGESEDMLVDERAVGVSVLDEKVSYG